MCSTVHCVVQSSAVMYFTLPDTHSPLAGPQRPQQGFSQTLGRKELNEGKCQHFPPAYITKTLNEQQYCKNL